MHALDVSVSATHTYRNASYVTMHICRRTDVFSTQAVPHLINALTEGTALPMLSAQNFTIIKEMEEKKKQKFSCSCKNIYVFGWFVRIHVLPAAIQSLAICMCELTVCNQC